jgi:RNA polymerase sigma-70 factor (ECF subfamily)
MNALQQSLIPYAYNILGSYEDAKDIVQDVMLEMINRQGDAIENEKAYLTRSVINRAINTKNRQKKIISSYPGNWLPEPVATEAADNDLLQKDILSYSLMVLLEKLDAKQRAVFILKEAFNYEHEEIANLLDISVENSRKILSRARKEVKNEPVNNITKTSTNYLDKYIDAIRSGDIKRVEQLLSEDIVVISDGGGKVAAALKPLEGKARSMAFLLGIHQKFYHGQPFVQGWVNHHPALLYYEAGKLLKCQVFELKDGLIHRIYIMRNPDKLVALEGQLAMNK